MAKKNRNYISLFLLLDFTPCFGTELADAHIAHLNQAIQELNARSSMPAFFPKKIVSSKNLFASYSSYAAHPDFHQFWVLSIDNSPECRGNHLCQIASLTAEKNSSLSDTYQTLPDQTQHQKIFVLLLHQQIAYYTPGHTEADFHPGKLEWQQGNVLYTFTWNDLPPKQEQSLLIEMLNSSA
jgi:hypothetical protein